VSAPHRSWLLYSAIALVLGSALLGTGTAGALAAVAHHRTVATNVLKGPPGWLRPAHADQQTSALAHFGRWASIWLVDCGMSAVPPGDGGPSCLCQSPRAPPCPVGRVP
jgi:hypothetical protein